MAVFICILNDTRVISSRFLTKTWIYILRRNKKVRVQCRWIINIDYKYLTIFSPDSFIIFVIEIFQSDT